MHTTISKQTKAELLAALRARYHRAPKADKTKVLDEFVAGCHAFAAHQRHNRGRTNLWGRESMLLQPMKAIVARMLSRPGISGLTSQLYEWPRKHGTRRNRLLGGLRRLQDVADLARLATTTERRRRDRT